MSRLAITTGLLMKASKSHSHRTPLLAALGLLVSALAACSSAPVYQKPEVAAPLHFKEEAAVPAAVAGDAATRWQPAQPAAHEPRGQWWQVFGDPVLDDLETQALAANQNLKAAAARLKQARALQQVTGADRFPTLDAGFGPTRQRVSPASLGLSQGSDVPAQTLWRAQAGVSYEADLFGRVADSLAAAKADTQQSEALLRSVQLALQADVAQSYFHVRELDAQADVFAHTVSLREQALVLVDHRFREGEIGELDFARARSELASARSDAMTVARSRATAEHALAVLLGKAPADFTLPVRPLQEVSIRIPPGLPSSLLQRRPDIDAAERAMAAANARIGVAKSAYFPSLTLTGAAGFESGTLGNLLQWSSRTFLLGPLVGTALSVPLFDGGRRAGTLANARAIYEEDVADYRQQVLQAFQEVEDRLADLRILEDQRRTQDEAMRASARAAQLSRTQYKEGSVSYLEVIDAERTVLLAQQTSVQLVGAQANSTVNLIRALGGGWQAPGATP